jgi:prephenate dehydrogenase
MDIFASNREFILQTSRQLRAVLSEMESCLEDGDTVSLADKLTRARAGRARIPSVVRGFLPAVYEVLATVPDRPGAIGGIAGILGEQGINIVDIEILRIREGDGGTLRLAFRTDVDAEAALFALQGRGLRAKRR